MRRKIAIPLLLSGLLIAMLSSSFTNNNKQYTQLYLGNIHSLNEATQNLYAVATKSNLNVPKQKQAVIDAINTARLQLKACDFWFRYLEPVAYKKLNGPLPVEWETEVFEKYEAPYKREGAGFTLAFQYLETENPSSDSLQQLIAPAIEALAVYTSDSIASQLNSYQHFFLCNRLYLLDLATIYTSGFDCPDTNEIIPELLSMMQNTKDIYGKYNLEFSSHELGNDYLGLYNKAIAFVKNQPANYEAFNHFIFIRDFVNPLFRLNQQHISQYKVQSKSWMDYTLNDEAQSIFDKSLYRAQNTKGIYNKVTDKNVLAEIDSIGKLLFYDPILSGDNKRSCASCHKLDNFLADTSMATELQFNSTVPLSRNQPSLVNAVYNHLLHADGKFLTLQDQAKGVITNPEEMGGNEEEAVKKIMSIPVYKEHLNKLAKQTNEKVSLKHIISAITYFYGKFSNYYSPFDDAMNNNKALDGDAVKGFNVFMGKAQCGTCHFAPQFNGIKPPYINNEFEVIGVPADAAGKKLSKDDGRFAVHQSIETRNAFRTPTIRNAAQTKPYMHNGVYKAMEEVIDFYDAGGGAGKGLSVNNQTLASDSLHLTKEEKTQLISFINSLTENIPFEKAPQHLPLSKDKTLNRRKPGGEY